MAALLFLAVSGLCGQEKCLYQEPDTIAGWGDVVISEIMADPNPPVGWDLEYIEIYSRKEKSLSLKDWKLRVGGRNVFLSGESVSDSLYPGEYRVLKLSSLPNEGSNIQLFNEIGNTVHAVSYRHPPFAPGWKKEGGWSLESPDTDCLCNTSGYWEYSSDPSGGTPGRENSCRREVEDLLAPVFLYHGYGKNGDLYLQFSETIFFESSLEASVNIRPGGYRPLMAVTSSPFHRRLELVLPSGCREIQKLRISLAPIYDCSGNRVSHPDIIAARPEVCEPGFVLITEVMFSPAEGKVEFVELFNPGPVFADLEDLAVGLCLGEGEPENFYALSDHSRILCPGQYAVLCRRSDELMLAYELEPAGSWVEVDGLPVLPDGGGEVVLADRAGNNIDRAPFSDDMHLDLLGDHRGISLERMDMREPGWDRTNWHSAAFTIGYATPGRANSQEREAVFPETGFRVEPKVFSPDNDGFEDVLEIHLQTEDPGTLVRLWITDPSGRLIRIISDTVLGGPENRFFWDGRNDQAYLQKEGFYVLHLLTMNPHSGKQERRRVACGLVYR